MFSIAITALFVLFLPTESLAWGPGFHLQLGTSLLANLGSLPASVASVIGAFPNDFLYGSIAADITLGKKFTHYLLHCHRWHVGKRLLEEASTDSQRACSYGYLSHLAADSVAHCYYVPISIMRSYQTLSLNHAYWEVRFDSFVDPELWTIGRRVALEHFKDNDQLLRQVISNTLFSFGTNKRIFNSILLVNRLEKWQQLMSAMNEVSRHQLNDEEREEMILLSTEAVIGILSDLGSSSWLEADPTGEHALKAAESVRKNLRILYRTGKITKDAAGAELDSLKGKLKGAMFNPELLSQIVH
jgi:zinc dependent phospholipase C